MAKGKKGGVPMIVEFFGPPGAGKTTLALGLRDRLSASGFQVALRLSARPGEASPSGASGNGGGGLNGAAQWSAVVHRLASPLFGLVASAIKLQNHADTGIGEMLADELPQGNLLRSFRLKNYLARMRNDWSRAEQSRRIWVFDQGYVQAVVTVAMIQPTITIETIVGLLKAVPQSDVVIHVKTPANDIEGRIAKRNRAIGRVGRLFEEDLGDAAKQAELAERFEILLRGSGRLVLSVTSSDGQTAYDAVAEAANAIVGKFSSQPAP
jgi:thymidylate kinase